MHDLSEKKIKRLIVVPCYNEVDRLPVKEFLGLKEQEDTYVLFVNDGSTDSTETIIETNFKETDGFYYLPLKENGGKANAVQVGMIHALSLNISSKLDYIGFFDADLATPLSEIDNFFRFEELFYSQSSHDVKSIWGSRIYRCGAKIERSLMRHILGRFFATVSTLILGVQTYDSQCGAKFFKKEVVNPLFERPFISKWIFDLEIYMRLKEQNWEVIEYPLKSWFDKKGSKIRLFNESFRVFRDLLKIRKEYQTRK